MRFSMPKLGDKREKKDKDESTFFEDRWGTIICLVGIFILAFFVRTYFAFELSTKFGTPYLLTGGSDAYYYERIVEYIAFNNRHLLHDNMLNYPLGLTNPRPPMFGWTTALSAYFIYPFVGDLTQAVHYSFILSTGFWGALTIFPTYLVGRDTFGKKAGIAAAFLLAISAGHLQRSIIGNGDHDAIYLFFIVAGFYFFMKALKGIPEDKVWVKDWKVRKDIKKGINEFVSGNKRSLLYAAMAGMCVATVALSWQGYAYVFVIILAYYYVQLFIDKFRYRDSLGVTFCVGIVLSMALLLAAPFYLTSGVGARLPDAVGIWYDVPLILTIIAMVGGVFLTISRDYPWVLVFSTMAAVIAGVLFYAVYINPAFMTALTTGAGYFVRTPAIETIAEAQAPEFSNLVLSFGPASFFLSVAGIALAIWNLKGKWTTDFLFILVWTAFAIYMATSAARFIFNGSPAFALTAGWVIAIIVDRTEFNTLYDRVKSFRGDLVIGLKRGVKARHVITALFLVFLIMLPNVMYGFDAGIPFEEKGRYDDQIHSSLPEFMRPDADDERQQNWHLGAFGYGLDKPTDYWPAAWEWLDEKNSHIPPEQRPGFMSWWDYGFESVQRGKHPTAADNFLSGHRFAGNILMSQNETEMVSLMLVRMLEAPVREDGGLEGDIRTILENHLGREKTDHLEDVMLNREEYREVVLSNPDIYRPRAEDMHPQNVMYAKTMGLLATEELDTITDIYREITDEMGKLLKYLAVDTRLFPMSARQTGIFYAPAKLSGHRIGGEAQARTPIDFFTILYVDEQGNEYEDPDDIPPEVRIVDYKIDYTDMFYNTALYRVFVGYANHWVGADEGIPGLGEEQQQQQPQQQQEQPMPGWGLEHFRIATRTAYYNPYPHEEVRDHPEAWRAVSLQEALEYQERGEGTVDLSAQSYMRQGVVILEYSHGALVSGRVTTEDGTPIPEARVTVTDEYGTPHHVSYTDQEGNYEVKAPRGEISIHVTTGGQEGEAPGHDTEPPLTRSGDEITFEDNPEDEFELPPGEEMPPIEEMPPEEEMPPIDQPPVEEPPEEPLDQQKLTKTENIVLASTTLEISEEQAMRRKRDRTGDGRWDYLIREDMTVPAGEIDVNVFIDVDDSEEYSPEHDTLVPSSITIENERHGVRRESGPTDGSHTFSGLIPGVYKLNTDVGTEEVEVYVQPGETATEDIAVDTSHLEGSVEVDEDIDYSDIRLYLEEKDGDEYWSTTIDDQGNYTFSNVYPGTYTLGVEEDEFTLRGGPLVVELQRGETEERILNITHAQIIEGEAVKEDSVITNQRISISGIGDHDYYHTIRTDESGQFRVKLPEGVYSIYGLNQRNEDKFAHLGHLNAPYEGTYRAEFTRAFRLRGRVEIDQQPVDQFNLFITSEEDGEMELKTNSKGMFSVVLPSDEYYIYGWHIELDASLFYSGSITLNSDTTYNLETEFGRIVRGVTYRETGESIEPEENLPISTQIELIIDGQSTRLRSARDGSFTVVIPDRDTEIRFEKHGYYEKVKTVETGEEFDTDLYLRAKNVTVEGSTVFAHDGIVPDGIPVVFEPIDEWGMKTQVDTIDGEYLLEVHPGRYEVSVQYSPEDHVRYIASEEIEILPGENVELPLTLKYAVRIHGSIQDNQGVEQYANITFQGEYEEEIRADGSYEIYLPTGSYSYWAKGEDEEMVGTGSFEEDEPKQVNLTLEEAVVFNPLVRYDEEPREGIPVEFQNIDSGFSFNHTTDVDGGFEALLAPGQYSVSVDHITTEPVRGVTRKVHYTYSEEYNVVGSTSPHIPLEREFINATLYGTVALEDEVLEGVEVTFEALSPEAMSKSTVTTTGGHFEIELSKGMYSVYTVYETSIGHFAAFHEFVMTDEDDELDISLERARTLYGAVFAEGERLESEVLIRSEDGLQLTLETDSNGEYFTALPEGFYTIEVTAEMEREIIGLTQYRKSEQVDLQFNTERDIELEKVEEYGIEIGEVREKSARPGDTLVYDVSIKNTGNVHDDFIISDMDAVWDMEFDPDQFSLDPQQSRSVRIKLHVHENASVSHPPIRFEVESLSSGETESRTIRVNVAQHHGVELHPEVSSKEVRDGKIIYTIPLENTGNGEDTYSLYIRNRPNLETLGWDVSLDNRTVEANDGEIADVEIILTPITSRPSGRVRLEIEAVSQGDNSVRYTENYHMEVPAITSDPGTLFLVGEGIFLEREPFELSRIHWALIIIGVVIAGIYVARKRRWF